MKESIVFENESKHLTESEGYRTIHLYKFGTFLRAYNYSAFLVNRFSLKDIKVVRPGGKDDKVFLGVPENSFDKILSEENIEKRETPTEETVDILLKASLFAKEDTPDSLEKDYRNWHDCVPSTAAGPKGKLPAGVPAFGGIFNILKDILDYPLDRKTPIENIEFISDLKGKITKVL